LNEPLSIILSSDLSQKLFGKEPALGKQILYNNGKVITVSAVFKEPQKNSCFRFSSLTSMDTKKILEPQNGEFTEWRWSNFQTFLLFEKGYNPMSVTNTILQLIPANEKENYSKASLYPFRKIHFSNLNFFENNFKKPELYQGNISNLITTVCESMDKSALNIIMTDLNPQLSNYGLVSNSLISSGLSIGNAVAFIGAVFFNELTKSSKSGTITVVTISSPLFSFFK
jgi:putative ABC transport system permease protein